jgi:lysophospholipid hydrolase
LAGDTLSLDSSDFYVVVDGTMQVYAQIRGNGTLSPDPLDEDEDNNGFQLLNEVETGGTLSSLFTILKLFTEDVKMRYEEETGAERDERPGDDIPSLHLDLSTKAMVPNGARSNRQNGRSVPQQSHIGKPAQRKRAPSKLRSSFSSGQTVTPEERAGDEGSQDSRDAFRQDLEHSGPAEAVFEDDDNLSSDGGRALAGRPRLLERRRGRADSTATQTPDMLSAAQESTIARAKVDATLAVIPADAFKRLTKKFPKASAHIVQGESRF